MPDYGLSRNYELTPANIDIAVTRVSAGVYGLGRSLNADRSIPIRYVGRADEDVKDRLQKHASEQKYRYFAFAYFPSAYLAYRTECELYHQLGGPGGHLDNRVHPAAPAGSNLSCPMRCGS